MKKVLALLFLLTSLCFGSEFKSYEKICFYECAKILNNLSKDYLILSYKILPSEFSRNTGSYNYSLRAMKNFNMIVEIEKIEEIN